MENKNGASATMIICAVILGFSLLKKFDFQTFRFEKPALSAVYFIGLAICLYLIFSKKGQSKE